eukprot:284816611_3
MVAVAGIFVTDFSHKIYRFQKILMATDGRGFHRLLFCVGSRGRVCRDFWFLIRSDLLKNSEVANLSSQLLLERKAQQDSLWLSFLWLQLQLVLITAPLAGQNMKGIRATRTGGTIRALCTETGGTTLVAAFVAGLEKRNLLRQITSVRGRESEAPQYALLRRAPSPVQKQQNLESEKAFRLETLQAECWKPLRLSVVYKKFLVGLREIEVQESWFWWRHEDLHRAVLCKTANICHRIRPPAESDYRRRVHRLTGADIISSYASRATVLNRQHLNILTNLKRCKTIAVVGITFGFLVQYVMAAALVAGTVKAVASTSQIVAGRFRRRGLSLPVLYITLILSHSRLRSVAKSETFGSSKTLCLAPRPQSALPLLYSAANMSSTASGIMCHLLQPPRFCGSANCCDSRRDTETSMAAYRSGAAVAQIAARQSVEDARRSWWQTTRKSESWGFWDPSTNMFKLHRDICRLRSCQCSRGGGPSFRNQMDDDSRWQPTTATVVADGYAGRYVIVRDSSLVPRTFNRCVPVDFNSFFVTTLCFGNASCSRSGICRNCFEGFPPSPDVRSHWRCLFTGREFVYVRVSRSTMAPVVAAMLPARGENQQTWAGRCRNRTVSGAFNQPLPFGYSRPVTTIERKSRSTNSIRNPRIQRCARARVYAGNLCFNSSICHRELRHGTKRINRKQQLPPPRSFDTSPPTLFPRHRFPLHEGATSRPCRAAGRRQKTVTVKNVVSGWARSSFRTRIAAQSMSPMVGMRQGCSEKFSVFSGYRRVFGNVQMGDATHVAKSGSTRSLCRDTKRRRWVIPALFPARGLVVVFTFCRCRHTSRVRLYKRFITTRITKKNVKFISGISSR